MSTSITSEKHRPKTAIKSLANSAQRLQAVTCFWREVDDAWFSKIPEFDIDFRERYLDAYEIAASGGFNSYAFASASCALGLIILLDQFPRNSFRGEKKMYLTDANARKHAFHALELGLDQQIEPALRLFFYLPFAHSENIFDQNLSVKLNSALNESCKNNAEGHRDIIRRFGRFPHRNSIMGRISRPDEVEFLASGGFAG